MRFTASVIGPGSASKWKFHAPFLFYQQQKQQRAERKIMIDDSSLFDLALERGKVPIWVAFFAARSGRKGAAAFS